MPPIKERPEKIIKIFHEVNEHGRLYELLNGLNGAVNKFGDAAIRLTDAIIKSGSSGEDLKQLRTAIQQLTERMEKKLMGLTEDFAALSAKFDGLESATTAVADDIAALKRELEEANARANIDLAPLIARAEGIEAGLRAAVGSQPGSDPAAPPAPPA